MGELVGELVSVGLAREEASAPDGRPGRPSPAVHLDDRHVAALAVDIGVSVTSVAAVSVGGEVIRSATVPTPPPPASPAQVVDVVTRAAVDIGCRGGAIAGRSILGVGVGVPGLVRRDDHSVAVVPNLRWRDVDIAGMLSAGLSDRAGIRAAVRIGNEANLGAMAEFIFGAAAHSGSLLYVSGEVGVGGAVIVDGELLAGRFGFAGELGHMPVNPDGQKCHCGGTGCWETEIGERTLLERAGLEPGQRDQLVPAVENGDQRALAAIADLGRWVGIGLTGLINIIDPEVVVFGGPLADLLPLMSESLHRELENRRFQHLDRNVELRAAGLGADATLIGAGELAYLDLLADPAGLVRRSA